MLKADPNNPDLLSRAFLSVLTDGDIEQAGKLADKLLQVDHTDRIARLVVGVRALKQKQYAVARQNFAQSVHGPVTDLTATLLTAWALYGSGDPHAAVDDMDKLAGPDWYGIFKDLHAGLILDLANNKKDAAKRYESAYKVDPTALRTVQAYGRFLSRNGGKDAALKVYQDFDKALPDHPLIMEEMKQVTDGDKLPPLVDTAQAGAAEALYGIGASIGRRGGEDLALVYLQLALYLEPSHVMALLSLADLYETLKKPDLAIKVYDRVPAIVAAVAQRRDRARRRSRFARSDRRGQEAARSRHRRSSEGHRSVDGARQYRARAQGFRRMRRHLQQGHRHDPDAGQVELGGVLLPRHLLRALASVAERRGRHEKGARAVSRSAAGAQLSRLFVGRSGRASRRRHGHDPPRGRAAAG